MQKRTITNEKKINNSRTLILFFLFLLGIIIMLFFAGWHQIVKGEEYKALAISQQKEDGLLEAERGSILDRNGAELAKTTATYTVTGSHLYMTNSSEKKEDYENNIKNMANLLEMETEELYLLLEGENRISGIASILKMSPEELAEAERIRNTEIVIKEDVTKEVADKVDLIPGISVNQEIKRIYPYGDFASHVLGAINDTGGGLLGIELEYDDVLAGNDGRWINSRDSLGNPLASGTDEYFSPIDGSDVVLTIDQNIQYYTEEVVDRAYEKHNSEQIIAIVLEVETGDVLAMSATPSFDPNDPRKPTEESMLKEYEKMTEAEQAAYLNKVWRNPAIVDVHEPGSTVKLLTAAMALEEGIIDPSSTFTCNGFVQVADAKIQCSVYPNSHGEQTLFEAVSNSCNPAHIEMATALGIEKFYDYLNLFGVTEKTGIDYPGEASPILQSEEEAGPVGIATIGFGQGLAISPIQLIAAIASFGNEGNLMQPRLVKGIIDDEGKEIEFEPNVVRKTVSEETVDEIKNIMVDVVEDGTGGSLKIPGYTVGGKTATSEIEEGGVYTDKRIGSIVAMAPMEDPKIAVLFMNVAPQKGGTYSSVTAGPWAKEILESTLKYLDIEPSNGEEVKDDKVYVTVPNVVGKTENEAIKLLESQGFKYNISPSEIVGTNFKVKGQYPESGEQIQEGGMIYIYKE